MYGKYKVSNDDHGRESAPPPQKKKKKNESIGMACVCNRRANTTLSSQG